jgi:hypothetical protein
MSMMLMNMADTKTTPTTTFWLMRAPTAWSSAAWVPEIPARVPCP